LKCDHEVIIPVDLVFEYYVCPKCYRSHKLKNGVLSLESDIQIEAFDSQIPVGSNVVLDGQNYWVSNGILKKSDYGEYWKEYELVSASGNYKYITEECGNWTISEQIELDKNFDSREISHDDNYFALFDKGTCQNRSGVGFFDFKLGKGSISYKDFISPPELLSVEVEEGEQIVYYGEHISAKEVRKLFDLTTLPYKSQIGMVQPSYFDLRKCITTFCYATLIVLISHLFFYQSSENQLVYSKTIDMVNDVDKEFVTDVFELKGPIAPLKIFIQTDVDNSWVATDFTLINKTTGETAFFSTDVEYYHGYEDGENWVEGSTSEEFNVCGVSSGKYSIAFQSNKDSADVANSRMKIEVYWDKSDNWNFMFVLIAFLAASGILFYIKTNFEQRRWHDSDYSPYSKEED